MRVLIACEYSGKVREAFRRRGHEAYSCDLLESDDNSPHHYRGDCWEVIGLGWDLIIMHPPCTALAVSGNAHYGSGMKRNGERLEAIEWTLALYAHAKENAPQVAMENPVGVLPIKASQYVQPYDHGHSESKKTGLWLHNLSPLLATRTLWPINGGALMNKEKGRQFSAQDPSWLFSIAGVAVAFAVIAPLATMF